MIKKRLFDLLLVSAGVLVIWPLGLIVALLIWLMDGWPVLFQQTRVGRFGTHFTIYKFRTMRQVSGSSLTVGQDQRITRLGGWLRRFKLDELPQLLNVLKGEMSLVGPRPEVPEYVNLYTPEQQKVLQLVPGITDPASLKYYSESQQLALAADPRRHYIDVIMPDKIRINMDYAESAGVGRDCAIIFRTIARSAGLNRESRSDWSEPVD